MPITALPTPPTRSDPSNFAARADAFLAALPTFQSEANALQTDVNNKQSTASADATTATTQAGIATTQAGIATTQATTATTQAGIATTQASNALASANAAAASYDSFDDRYLGAKASNPTLDNDGGALLTGAMYWNTTNSELRFWNGSAWVTVNLNATNYLTATNNLTDLGNVATARTNLNVPTRTGGDASGSWGISVTGSSASCTGNAATATTATNATNATNATTSTTQASSVSSTAIATTAYVKSLFGAAATTGTLDWNDSTNVKPGTGPTLLMGNATNGPGVASYFHVLNFEHQTKDGTGNITQFAISYANHKDMWFRGRMTGVWNAWTRILHSENINGFAPTLTGGGASGTWNIDITGSASDATKLAIASNLSDLNNVTTARSNLGLANSATIATGTSGATIPLLNGANTWSGKQTVQLSTAATNTVTQAVRVDSQSSGTPAVGIGVGIEMAVETAAGNTEVGATIEAVTTDVTAASEDFDLVFKTMAAGAAASEGLRVKNTGGVSIPTGASYQINGAAVLSSSTLGSSVTASSLTSVGTISSGTWAGTDVAILHGGTGASDAATARTNLGLGTAATANTGTSGATIPLLNGVNTWSGVQTFSSTIAGSINGNAATATTAGACSGNAATATTAGACSGNAATVTNGVYTTGDQTIGGIKTLTGATVIQRNTVSPVYSSGHLELRTTDFSPASLGFHRSGATACQLRHDANGLILSGSSQTAAADFYTYGSITAAGNFTALGSISGAGLDISGQQRSGIVAVGALDIACGSGNYFTKTIAGASTFTFSGAPASRAYSFTLELTHTSGTITWPAAVQWPGGTAPSLTTGKTHLFIFVTDDGGTRWRGSALTNYTN